jgi:uncharacterized protein YegP (UPF0339 family)
LHPGAALAHLRAGMILKESRVAHRFEIRKNKAGEFVAYFCYNAEAMFWTEGYSSKAAAKNAIESIKKNGPAAEVDDTTD